MSESLNSPTALSLRAWALVAPLVLLDALVAEFVVVSEPEPSRVPIWLGSALIGYLISGALYLAGYSLLRVPSPAFVRILVVLVTFTASGAVWVALVFAIAEGKVTVVSPLLATATGALLQLTAGVVISVLLYAKVRADLAETSVDMEVRAWRDTEVDLLRAELEARREFRRWISQFLIPGVHRIEEQVKDATWRIEAIDEFRESVVKMTSWRIHPRVVDMGARASLTAVLRSRGLSGAELRIETQAEESVTADQLVALARCLDMILQGSAFQGELAVVKEQMGSLLRVALTLEGESIVLEIHGLAADTSEVEIRAPEIFARLRQHHGKVHIIPGGIVILTIDHENSVQPVPVDPATISVPLVASLSLSILSLCVVALISNSILTALAAALAASSVGLMIRYLPLPLAVISTSGVVTTTWAWISGASLLSALTFFGANSLVIAGCLFAANNVKSRIANWSAQVEHEMELAESIRYSCAQTSLRIDKLRASFGHLLHSQVQARLVVTAGYLMAQPPDTKRALQATTLIQQIDIPELVGVIDGIQPDRILQTFVDRAARREDVSINFTIRGEVPPARQGTIVGILEEGVTNALRHGRANRVDIQIESDSAGSRLVVNDNGLGASSVRQPGLGLTLIDFATAGNWTLEGDAAVGTVLVAEVLA
jgi:signal transduction histidine kinase